MRLVKIKEGQQFQFFAFNAIDVYANKFQSTNKVIFTCAKCGRPSFLFFRQEIKSDFLSLTDHQKRIGKVEKFTFWANPDTVCILQSFILRFCDERASIVNPHLTTVTLNSLVIFQNSTAA